MKEAEFKLEKNRLEELQEIINGSKDRINAEFAKTANSWLECFGSSVFVIETRLASSKLKEMISPEQYRIALQRVEELKEKLSELKQQYPQKDTVPEDEIKEELLVELDVFRKSE